MRRRKPTTVDLFPRWLLEYRPQDWPRTACHPECAYWRAVRAWQLDHPDEVTPLGIGPDGPPHLEAL